MKARHVLACTLAATLLGAAVATPARAQSKELTDDYIELIIKAFRAEHDELEKVAPQIQAVDEKIKKFNDCKQLYEAAGDVSGSKLGGFAAKAAIRAKCGASDTDGYMKDKQKIMEGPQKAALSILGMKAGDYGKLKEKLQGYLQSGDGFNAAEIARLAKRKSDIAGAMGIDLRLLAAGGSTTPRGGNGRSPRMGGAWTSDYAWQYIGQMFEVMYLSGATVFEKPYQPGQWTKWEIVQRDAGSSEETKRVIERAFIGKTPEGSEWWRTTSVDFYDDGGTQKADTVVLESLFKQTNEYIRELVRVRAKLPGQEPNELMVPQAFAMLSSLSIFPMKPTPESIKGATVGNEKIGQYDASQVRFAAGGGTIEWWLAETAPGGWVQFRMTGEKQGNSADTYTIRMTGSGTGAKSLLGVM
jgi:hypothetical protein